MESLASASLDSLHEDISIQRNVKSSTLMTDLLNKHIKEVADHFSKFHSEGGPPGEHIIPAGEKTHGLASILRWKCTLCDEEISSSLSQKLMGQKVTSIGPATLQQYGVKWSQVVDSIHYKSQ